MTSPDANLASRGETINFRIQLFLLFSLQFKFQVLKSIDYCLQCLVTIQTLSRFCTFMERSELRPARTDICYVGVFILQQYKFLSKLAGKCFITLLIFHT